MARRSVSCTVGSSTVGAENFGLPGQGGDPNAGATFASLKTTFEADLATLVADGAAPTQAHVNTVNSDYTALAATFGVVLGSQDVELVFDVAKVGSRSVLRRAVAQLLAQCDGMGDLTP